MANNSDKFILFNFLGIVLNIMMNNNLCDIQNEDLYKADFNQQVISKLLSLFKA